ncbi:MAG: tRNA 2-thiouridine(34) synthase MnmA [Oscillospiraceae bacterium]|nr:tRNA 2-thiouridine(34) synthase MnmA [Oscillospiraceae bacterium]
MPKKVLVALSGGVDSAVCAHLLREQGCEVAGLVLRMSPAHDGAVRDAEQVARQLGIPLMVGEMGPLFQREVVDYFIAEYRRGRTPNPCVVCNPRVKFKALLDTADREGFDCIATGHYAALRREGEHTLLCRGEALERDQSYMLCRLGQPVLSRLLLPLAALPKEKVREIAASLGLDCARKPDSQENCFIPDNDYAGYIEARAGACPEGDFISPEGQVCGRHKGILHYTVGQRKKLGIALGRPVFIKRIDPDTNRIYLADSGDEYAPGITVTDLTMTFPGSLRDGMRVCVKIRSRAPLAPCTIRLAGDRAEVLFDQPQRAPAPGQLAAFYDGEVVLGGGFME